LSAFPQSNPADRSNWESLGQSSFVEIGSSAGLRAPGFFSPWGHLDAAGPNRRAVGFWVDPLGVVHLEGFAVGGTTGSPIFQLPPGYRIARDRGGNGIYFPAVSNLAFGYVFVVGGGVNDGNVLAGLPAVGAWISLAGVTFKADH
jgi:hypothetical protein